VRRAFNPCATTDSGDGLPGEVLQTRTWFRPRLPSAGPLERLQSRQPDQERTAFGLGCVLRGRSSDVKFSHSQLQGTGQIRWNLYQLQCQVYLW
jgi:hypothetical protein